MACADTPYIASVNLWAGSYAPRNWAFCLGQILAIAQYSSLYTVMGTAYGGDARTTFGLPDMRGRVPVGAGKGPQSSIDYQRGTMGGSEYITLTLAQMPQHSHSAIFASSTTNLAGSLAMPVKTGLGTGSSDPSGKYLGSSGSTALYYSDYTAGSTMAAVSVPVSGSIEGNVTVVNSGASQHFLNLQPFSVLYYIICLVGVYPPRS